MSKILMLNGSKKMEPKHERNGTEIMIGTEKWNRGTGLEPKFRLFGSLKTFYFHIVILIGTVEPKYYRLIK